MRKNFKKVIWVKPKGACLTELEVQVKLIKEKQPAVPCVVPNSKMSVAPLFTTLQ